MLVAVDANTVFSALLTKFIKGEIDFTPFEEFNRYADEAEEIAPHAKDVQYFALALSFHAAIWSNEKAFKKQSVVKVFSTKDLISVLFSAP